MPINLARIYRYPVKGLTPEPLTRVAVAPGLGLPHDRRFALAHGVTRFDPAAPAWMPKTNFLMLMKNERLAALRTQYDERSGELTVMRDGLLAVSANIGDASGLAVIEKFFASYMGAEADGEPRLLEAPGHMFSDVARKVVSIIGLSSVRSLERAIGHAVDPRRFRANFYLEGGAPWQEFEWVDRGFSIGDVRLRGCQADQALCRNQCRSRERGARSQYSAGALQGFWACQYGHLR
jgi:MOSC domain-containing protein